MSSPPSVKEMRTLIQLETRIRLEQKNKEAARAELLRIQLLLARKTSTK